MARLSISEAARQANCSRQYLHKLIKTGTLTASKDENNQPYIDDSELLRVFNGRLPRNPPVTSKVTGLHCNERQAITPTETPIIDGLQVEVTLLREQLLKSEERERRLMDQIDKLTDTIKQIEHKPEPVQPTQPAEPEYRPSWIVRVLTTRLW